MAPVIKCILIFLSIWLLSVKLYGQTFYTVDGNGALRRETISSSGITSQSYLTCYPGLYSIASLGKVMYFITGDDKIYKADIGEYSLTNCTFLTSLDGVTTFTPTSLTVDKNGVLYFASGTALYKCDTSNPTIVLIGLLPDYSAGDLVFYDNELYMAGGLGIYKVNIAAPMQSTLIIPTNGVLVWGLVSVGGKKGDITVYGLALGAGTDLIKLDLKNGTMLGRSYNLNYTVYDGASEVENGVPVLSVNKVDVGKECDAINKGYITITPGTADPYIYTLNTGQRNTTGAFNNLDPGQYTVHITTNDPDAIPIDIPFIIPDYSLSKPVVRYDSKLPVCDLVGSLQFKTTANSSDYSIQYNAVTYPFNHVFDLQAGYYHFQVLDNKNCLVDTLYIDFTKSLPCNSITFPNTFTPNSDGINDLFRPNQDSRGKQYQLSIYNRYGELLFISKNLHLGWDGQHQGKPLPTGTYYWMATYTDEKGQRNLQKGYVALIR